MTQNFFQGLKVIELASVLAGPAVGMFFAELGASVIKVENARTGGDVTRIWKLPQEDADSPSSAYFFSVNWGKEHVFLDLRQADDLAQLLGWVAEADLVISNFKAGSAEKMGLDAVSLRKLNPRLIYASISAYGKNDPRPGFDVAMQAETGWVFMNGVPGGQPCKLPVALIDLLSAHQLKEGILVALLHRERTGEGSEVHVSLFDTAIASLANQAANYLNLGQVPQRMGSLHPNIAPYGEIFLTKDGQPLLLSTGTDKHFQSLCECLGVKELPFDERFSTNALRLANRTALQLILKNAFAQQPAALLLDSFLERKVPVSPIRNLAEVFELTEAQGLVLEEGIECGKTSKRVRTAVFEILP